MNTAIIAAGVLFHHLNQLSMATTMTSLTTRATVLYYICEMRSAFSVVIWIPIGIQIQIKVPCERGDCVVHVLYTIKVIFSLDVDKN